MKSHFINLTNGIQAIGDYGLNSYGFIRIQSTACEQKRWEDIIMQLSDDFLMRVALGKECVVYDYGANKETPRAIWQGLEWIKYVLYQRWLGVKYQPQGRAGTSAGYFQEQYSNLSRRAKARLDYFGRYCTGSINISSVTGHSRKDGDYEWFVNETQRRALA